MDERCCTRPVYIVRERRTYICVTSTSTCFFCLPVSAIIQQPPCIDFQAATYPFAYAVYVLPRPRCLCIASALVFALGPAILASSEYCRLVNMDEASIQGVPPETSAMTISIKRLFCPIVLISQIWGLAAVALALVWMRSYNGFGWSDNNVFNFHPVLLTTGMIYLYGQAILVYRLFRFKPKRILKICHAVLHSTIFIVTCIGLVAVFEFHNRKSIPNLYSLHSWIGLFLVIGFGLQFVMGLSVYLLPYASIRLRMVSMPFHRAFGLIMFGLAGATAVMGITEKAIFSEKECWSKRNCEMADIINWMGISIVLYVATVIFLVTTPEYRRVPMPSD